MSFLEIVNAQITPDKLSTLFKGLFVVLFILVMYFNRESKTREAGKKNGKKKSVA